MPPSEEDGKFLAAANRAMGIRDNAASNETGVATWNSTAASLNRSSLAEARKAMPRTRARLEPSKALINSITIKEIEKWQRDQIGGDLAQDMLIDSMSERKFAGMEWLVTIKHDLILEGSIYFWAEPKFLGENLQLEDTNVTNTIGNENLSFECPNPINVNRLEWNDRAHSWRRQHDAQAIRATHHRLRRIVV